MKAIELLGWVPLLLLGFTLDPKLQLGIPDDEDFGNRSCVALDRCSRRDSTSPILGVVPPASMQVAALRDWKPFSFPRATWERSAGRAASRIGTMCISRY